jgi:hypothetical protein
MNNGVLIFVFNNRDIDYARSSLIAGFLAQKNLNVPVSIVTDESTVKWMKESKIYQYAEKLFDKIILIERSNSLNYRNIRNGGLEKKSVLFLNDSRCRAWDLTPYDRTLLIDSDFLIYSDRLSEYWQAESSILISSALKDIRGDRVGYHDKYVSDTGPALRWATTVMFSKDQESKIFFTLVETIKENYQYFSDLYSFPVDQYRNDISFTIAQHMLSGFIESLDYFLPPVLTVQDLDSIQDIGKDFVRFFINDPLTGNDNFLCLLRNTDVHIMNKNAIVENFDKFERFL